MILGRNRRKITENSENCKSQEEKKRNCVGLIVCEKSKLCWCVRCEGPLLIGSKRQVIGFEKRKRTKQKNLDHLCQSGCEKSSEGLVEQHNEMTRNQAMNGLHAFSGLQNTKVHTV